MAEPFVQRGKPTRQIGRAQLLASNAMLGVECAHGWSH